jgi:hypothetical protein
MNLGGYVLVEGLIGLLALTGLALWLGGRMLRRRGPREAGDVDRDVLEDAEREARDQPTGQSPDRDEDGDDWGPGTHQPGRR